MNKQAPAPTKGSVGYAASRVRADVGPQGEPLDRATRDYFEPLFGHDFSRVRVHADSTSAVWAQAANAAAYSVNDHIVFGEGRYSPHTRSGQRLLAHELAHIVQQHNASGPKSYGSTYEAEATEASRKVLNGQPAAIRLAAAAGVQRQGLPELNPDVDLASSASPTMAAVIGSVALDDFVTAKANLSASNQAKLSRTGETIKTLLKRYPASAIRVIGHTDAVGQENDNQELGQSRADSVQAALVQMGIPVEAIHTESHGANDLLVRTNKAESRNRRVQVYFEPSQLGRRVMTGTLTAPQPGLGPGSFHAGDAGWKGLCSKNPTLCLGRDPSTPSLAPRALEPIPDDTPFKRMDVAGINAPYTSHGVSPEEGGDLRASWAQAYWRYRKGWGFPEEVAAKLANWEIAATAGKAQTRDNPNALDRSDQDIKRAYPDSTTVGPASVTIWRF
jgi:outer membrane protein OmpA-like peptidoglycan-associated protein